MWSNSHQLITTKDRKKESPAIASGSGDRKCRDSTSAATPMTIAR